MWSVRHATWSSWLVSTTTTTTAIPLVDSRNSRPICNCWRITMYRMSEALDCDRHHIHLCWRGGTWCGGALKNVLDLWSITSACAFFVNCHGQNPPTPVTTSPSIVEAPDVRILLAIVKFLDDPSSNVYLILLTTKPTPEQGFSFK